MQSGSLVATERSFKKLIKLGLIAIKGIVPEPNLVFTCKEVVHFIDTACIRLEECEVLWIRDNGVIVSGGEFKAKFWKELQAPREVNVEEIIEESICVLV